jgi:hypothetical protein
VFGFDWFDWDMMGTFTPCNAISTRTVGVNYEMTEMTYSVAIPCSTHASQSLLSRVHHCILVLPYICMPRNILLPYSLIPGDSTEIVSVILFIPWKNDP